MTAPEPKHRARAWRSKPDPVVYEPSVADQRTAFTVVCLSQSYSDVWEQLGRDVDAAVQLADATEPAMLRDAALVLVAAGGAERDAIGWLDGHSHYPDIPVIVVGSDPSRRLAVQLVRAGATDYLVLPDDLETLRNAIGAAVEAGRLRAQSQRAAPAGADDAAFGTIVGRSPAMMAVLDRAQRLLPHADATALIIGETGTGKELLARGIHDGGPRAAEPFVAVNCSAIPENLMESELFGHERGAFTNAHAAKPGLFEVADGGTLFLDEVGTLSPSLQAKLLRVLEDKEVRRVGGTKSRRVDVRILAATNENLGANLETGTFRQDLFFRLSVVTLSLPPLRAREDDVLLIAEACLTERAERQGVPVPRLGAEVQSALRGYHWPGNVRELRNAVERALLLSPPGELRIDELIPADAPGPASDGPLPFPSTLREITASAARATLELCNGNRSEAARRLEISRKRLRRLLNGGDPA